MMADGRLILLVLSALCSEPVQALTFPNTSYTFNVVENVKSGHVLGTVAATDSSGRTFRYSTTRLTVTDADPMFEINDKNGTVFTIGRPDRETLASYRFLVQAKQTSGSPPRASATTSMTIIVTDANDNAPMCEEPVYSIVRTEGPVTNPLLTTVRATDRDEGLNAKVRYRLATSLPLFSVGAESGEVRTIASAFDRETQPAYLIRVLAVDQSPFVADRLTATCLVNLTIGDTNDNVPQFSRASYSVALREDYNSANGPFLTVHASDRDSGANGLVSYRIINGNPRDTFTIGTTSGQLSVTSTLDYETRSSYTLSVLATDSGSVFLSNTTSVVVRILDLNDAAPVFSHALYRADPLPESVSVGHPVVTVEASDADSGVNGTVSFLLPESGLPFAIDSSSGVVRTTQRLDRETRASYHFPVEARDGGRPPLTATASVTVTVLDDNDNAPRFVEAGYRFVVEDDAAVGTEVGSVEARDGDENKNGLVSYSIVAGNRDGLFRIETKLGKGVIELASSVVGKRLVVVLTVQATDGGTPPLSNSSTVSISITAANLHTPVFSRPSYRIPVAENFPVGPPFYELRATDEDGPEKGAIGRVSYFLEATAAADFLLNSSTGELSLQKKLDRETKAAYTFTVTARDGGSPPRTAVANVVIAVGDVNDNTPIFEPAEVTREVSEAAKVGDLVVQMAATDADEGDNGRIVFGLSGGVGDFKINANDGKVRVAKLLDRETTASYRLIVTASDSAATSRLSSTAILNIKVLDVNDNRPVWPVKRLDMFVPENSPPNTLVGRLVATDPDVGPNAVIRYSLVASVGPDAAPADFFTVRTFNNSAEIVTTRATYLDYEKGPRLFNLTAQAHSGPLFSSVPVVIHVTDVNDHAPILYPFVIQLDNYAGQFPVGWIGRVPASDPDVTAVLTYRLVSGQELNILEIQPSTGLMKLSSSLNTNVDIDAKLDVEVNDGLFTATATCTVRTRYVTSSAIKQSVTVRVAATPLLLSQRLDALAASVSALFGQPPHSMLLLSLNEMNNSDSVITFAVKEWDTAKPHVYSFINASRVREVVFLQTRNINATAGVEIVPTDGGLLCVIEPCVNYKACREQNVYQQAANFTTISPYLLLRAIDVLQTASCECPAGFAGLTDAWSCDAEVNLCFSSPCKNGGSCQPSEGGFFCHCAPNFVGSRCEYQRSGPGAPHYDPPYPSDVCRPPSRFQPLIRGGFECSGCPTSPPHTSLCQLRSRFFSGQNSSHAALPPLKQRSQVTISLRFATVSSAGGVLLFAGRYSGVGTDELSLRLVGDELRARLSLGNASEAVEVSLGVGGPDGLWRDVRLAVEDRTLSLSLGGCDPALCAARRTVELDPRCASPTELCRRFLDLTTPLYVGGRPGRAESFEGCVGDVSIDGRAVDLLGDLAYEEGSSPGCPAKEVSCPEGWCGAGRCQAAWGRLRCLCPDALSGPRCSVPVPASQVFAVNGGEVQLDFSASPSVAVPQRIGVDFRLLPTVGNVTLFRQDTVYFNTALFLVAADQLLYVYKRNFLLHCRGFNFTDGEWHRVEVPLESDGVRLDVDGGACTARQSGDTSYSISTFSLRMRLQFGEGMDGCIRRMEVGWPANVTAPPTPVPVLVGNASRGCWSAGPGCAPTCQICQQTWRESQCACRPGYIGERCEEVCRVRSPCQGGARCLQSSSSPLGYTCQCPAGRSGTYCEIVQRIDCPDAWWGAPLCGPCNCDVARGFQSRCNVTNGQCSCLPNHYAASGTSSTKECRLCPCYAIGSSTSQCSSTGQCTCRPGVIGQSCDQCPDAFAEVTLDGCQVQYTACPQALSDGIWWPRTPLDSSTTIPCGEGLSGLASRSCSRQDGWAVPDTTNCVSSQLEALSRELNLLASGELSPTPHLVARFDSVLASALSNRSVIYEGDLRLGQDIVNVILNFEATRQGLELSHTQNTEFLPDLLTGVGAMLGPGTQERWRAIGGVAGIIDGMATYTAQLARQRSLNTRVDYSVANLVLRVSPYPFPGNSSPVALRVEADHHNVTIAISGNGSAVSNSSLMVGTLFYANLTGLLDESVNVTKSEFDPGPLQVSSGVLSLEVPAMPQTTTQVALRFSVPDRDVLLEVQCVFWNGSDWSVDGCSTMNLTQSPSGYVTCVCSHLSTFGVIARRPPLRVRRVPVTIPVSVYVLLSLSLLCLLPSVLFLGLVLRSGFNCLAVHFHSSLCLLLGLLLYLIGLPALQFPVWCRLTGLGLHFLSASCLAWLVVSVLHLHRRVTEVRDVDVGAMPFYLLLGYGLPGLTVALTAALKADDYGDAGDLCWLPLSSQTAVSVLFAYGAAGIAGLVLLVLAIVRMRQLGFLCGPRVKKEVEEEREMRNLGRSRQGKFSAPNLPSSLRYNRPDLLSSISRADSRRSSLSRLSDTRPAPRCHSPFLSAVSRRVEKTADGPAWAQFHLVHGLLLVPLGLLSWLCLYLGPASSPPLTGLWEFGAVAAFILSLIFAVLHSIGHARVIPALQATFRHGGTLPKEMRATALGGAATRYAPNPALEAEFNKLTNPATGASTSSTTTTSGGATVIPGVYLAPTTDSSTLNISNPTGFTNAILAASMEEDDSEDDEDDATVTSGDFERRTDLASSHSSDDDEEEEDEEMGPKWRLPDSMGRTMGTPSVHSSSQPTTTTDETLYGSTAKLIRPGTNNEPTSRTHLAYENPALVLSARDLAALGTAWSSVAPSSTSSPPLGPELVGVEEEKSDDGEETAV